MSNTRCAVGSLFQLIIYTTPKLASESRLNPIQLLVLLLDVVQQLVLRVARKVGSTVASHSTRLSWLHSG